MRHLDTALKPARRRKVQLASVVTAAVLVVTLTATGCSSSSKRSGGSPGGGAGNTQTAGQSPTQAVATAFRNTGDQSSIRLSVSMPLSAGQFKQLWSAMGHGTMPQAAAQALTTASVFFSASTGHGEPLASSQAGKDGDMSFDLGLTINGATPVEVRYTGHALYIHLMIGQVFSDLGQADSSLAKQVQSLLQLAQQYVPGLSALNQGKWVEVSQQTLKSLEPLVGQMGPGGKMGSGQPGAAGTTLTTSGTSPAPGAFEKLKSDVLRSLQGNVTVANRGQTGARTKYSATLNLSGFMTSVKPMLQNDLAGMPGGPLIDRLLFRSTRPVPPGRTLAADVYVADSRISEIDLDGRQFMSKDPGFAVPVRVTALGATSITAPTGAVQLDLSKMPVIIQGLLGQLNTGSSTTTG